MVCLERSRCSGDICKRHVSLICWRSLNPAVTVSHPSRQRRSCQLTQPFRSSPTASSGSSHGESSQYTWSHRSSAQPALPSSYTPTTSQQSMSTKVCTSHHNISVTLCYSQLTIHTRRRRHPHSPTSRKRHRRHILHVSPTLHDEDGPILLGVHCEHVTYVFDL